MQLHTHAAHIHTHTLTHMHTHAHTYTHTLHCYIIIQSQTIRGSIPEDAIPASSKPSSAKGLPPKDIIEHVCPEFSLSSLRVAKQDKKVMLLWLPNK